MHGTFDGQETVLREPLQKLTKGVLLALRLDVLTRVLRPSHRLLLPGDPALSSIAYMGGVI